MPRQIPPDAIIRDYRAFIAQRVAAVSAEFAAIVDELPAIVARNLEALRVDEDESTKIQRAIAEARRRMREKMAQQSETANVEQFARRISSYQMAQLQRQIQAGIGMDLLVTDRKISAMLNGFVANNVALISDVTESTAASYEKTILRGLQTGLRHEEIAKDLAKTLDISESRAAGIARDQVLTLYGQVNRNRQQSIGIEEYTWRASNDEKVRDSHRANDGKVFSWNSPPSETGHPSEDINCRCGAEPVFKGLLG